MQQVFHALTLGFAGVVVAANAGFAQGAQCAPRDNVVTHLAEKYGETRRGIGLAGQGTVMEVYAADATGTWTILMTMPNGTACMIASGAGQMKRVRNRGQAITTAVMGMLTLLTCTVPFPVAAVGTGSEALMLIPAGLLLALPAAGFGLWALLVLNRPEVVEAFARRKRKG